MKPGRTIHNLWIYRWIFAGALLGGLLVWFMLTNSEEVTVKFPFFGTLHATLGFAIVLSGWLGAMLMWAYLSVRNSLRSARQARQANSSGSRPAASAPPPPHPHPESRQDVRS